MITIITVASLKIVGAVLVEALFIIPAASARNISRFMKSFFFYSVAFSTASCLLGVILPIELEIPVPSGGAIILVASMFFLITALIRMAAGQFKEAAIIVVLDNINPGISRDPVSALSPWYWCSLSGLPRQNRLRTYGNFWMTRALYRPG
ncbi:metal ABC transporter permease [uncultured Desulfobacter sp.]|uniref:metal ABC transporter permease n=1 Tax=uncultured Desulfobacter sp. TaxID=240139 RepID=UPI002AABC640|nr:metal ABC transporter permease [uncultured Desulfobacter sp.]